MLDQERLNIIEEKLEGAKTKEDFMYKNVDEYIERVWAEEKLNEYSYHSGWHESIKEIIREVWRDSHPINPSREEQNES